MKRGGSLDNSTYVLMGIVILNIIAYVSVKDWKALSISILIEDECAAIFARPSTPPLNVNLFNLSKFDVTNVVATAYNASNALTSGQTMRIANTSTASGVSANLLFIATEDFIHQKFRQEAMPKSFALLNKLRGAGVAAFISGAGPTVLALHNGDANEIAELQRAAGSNIEVKPLGICTTGAGIIA